MIFVTIEGVDYPMKYGHITLKKYMHKYGLKKLVELEQLPGKLTVEDMPGFVKSGFDTAAKILGENAPFSLDQVNDLLESNLWLETVALEVFAKSIERPKRKIEDEQKEALNPEPSEPGN